MKPILGTVKAAYVHRPSWGGSRRRSRRKNGWLIITTVDFMGRAESTTWIKEDK